MLCQSIGLKLHLHARPPTIAVGVSIIAHIVDRIPGMAMALSNGWRRPPREPRVGNFLAALLFRCVCGCCLLPFSLLRRSL